MPPRSPAPRTASCRLRHRGREGAALALLCLALAPAAQAVQAEAAGAQPLRWEAESLPHALQARAVGTGARPLLETPNDGLRTRLWWGRGAVEVGAGADVNPLATAPGLAPSSGVGTAVVGLRARVAPSTHLAIERDTLAVGAGSVPPLDASRVALEFQAVGRTKAAAPLSSGLLRVQMSGSSSLQFRPRSGGLAVTYRAKF